VTVNHAVKEFRGKNELEAIVVEDRATGEIKEWKYDGVFVFIGLTPNSGLLKDKADLDKWGFIETKAMQSTMEGVFAAGDVRADSTKQAASAAGEGASAAIAIREYLNRIGG
jgi:thioredoxin reductase (NADPH)